MNLEQFKLIFPDCNYPEEWLERFDLLPKFGVITPHQVAAFCSQVGHESHDLNIMSENMNYSADRLIQVFPKYFRGVDSRKYARKPEMIANRVYANRMGNGPESSGDGWKYRGSGIIQLTGKNNFMRASESLYGDRFVLLDRPELVRTDKETAMLCALWFWEENELEVMTDIVAISKRVNGGTIGLEDRIRRYDRALDILDPIDTHVEDEQQLSNDPNESP